MIHTVGPVWSGGNDNEAQLLASCYRRCIELTEAHGLDAVAFPSISTGVYGYPIELASEVAFSTVRSMIRDDSSILQVTFCCFSTRDFQIYERLLDRF